VESATTTIARGRLTISEIQSFLPARGKFTFPAPYLTEGIRLTNESDCAGSDCVNYVGYSYWRNTNNHVGSDTMLIFLGLRNAGGPTLFAYNKVTDAVRKLGPLFPPGNRFTFQSGEGWYFSATQPTTLYLNDGAKLLRYDVLAKTFATVFDAAPAFGADRYIWQVHSSDDDLVHSATLRDATSYEMLGCLVYREPTGQFSYFPKLGDFDECNIDRSGRWLLIYDNVDGRNGLDNRIVDLQTGTETLVLDEDHAAGHHDMGYGYMVAADNWNQLANAQLLYTFGTNPVPGPVVYHNNDWFVAAPNHIAHGNAKPGIPPEQQYVCGSSANRKESPHSNEIICFRLDGSLQVLVVAPVMTDLDAAGGGNDYAKFPKGNIDITGQYFIWTSNMGGGRLDAFLVKIPASLLAFQGPDITPPSVSITAPTADSTLTDTVTVSATAFDGGGVAGVQFKLDGLNLAEEVLAPPFALVWDTRTAQNGVHTLAALARDGAGNATTSSPVAVTLANDLLPPALSAVGVATVGANTAMITWTTSEPTDARVEYGPTTAYGSVTALDEPLATAHALTLTGLALSTIYHYRVISRAASGSVAQSGDGAFTTTALAATSPDLIAHRASLPMVIDGALDDWDEISQIEFAGRSNRATTNVAWDATYLYVAFTVLDSELNAVQLIRDAVALWEDDAVEIYLDTRSDRSSTMQPDDYQFIVSLNNVQGDLRGTGGGKDPAWNAVWSSAVGRLQGDAGSGYAVEVAIPWSQLGVTPIAGLVLGADLTVDDRDPSGSTTFDYFDWAGLAPGSYSQPSAWRRIQLVDVAPPALEPVAWRNLVHTIVDGNALEKSSGCDGCADAGASSEQQIVSGDGYVEFNVTDTTKALYVGLGAHDTGTSVTDIDFGIRLGGGYAEVRENGRYRTDRRAASGDIFRVAVQSGTVTYFKNGTVFWNSVAPPVYPLRMDTSFLSLDAAIVNAVIWRSP
jgi:hypothetical protein